MAKKYKCPYCEKRLIRKDLITHIDRSHKELIPEDYTAARLVYNQVNKIDHGKCRVCGKSTTWSEKSGRYEVLCGDPKCKEHMREEYKKNMLRVKGTYNILNDPEQQKKMLANRSISGQYKFQDGGVLTYTGSYEKKCLEFMDVVMQIPSKDILSPGPTLEYEYNGEKHFYITDFYYIPYNLIIEVKDGGDNLNTKDSASMKASREKTIEKERLITDRGEYNYIRLTNNNFAQLIEVFMIIKEKLLEGDDSKTYRINESQVVLEDYFNESLEDVSGIIFGKRKLFQDKCITLYHGTDLGDLERIVPNSYNMGLKNAKPKMSSFWFNNMDYAITFATMTFIEGLSDDMMLTLDNDMKVLVEDEYKSKVINAIRGNVSYVYEKTIESYYVGYGHEGIFPEYTLDIPVKPDRCYVINDKQMLNHIKFCFQGLHKIYKDGKMVFNSTLLQYRIDKMLYYKDHNDRVSKIKKVKAYKEACELSSSNTGIINPQWKVFADYMCTKYKVNNSIKINIKFLHSKVSFDTMGKKYNDDASTNATIRDRNTIYVLDEDIYNKLYYDNYNNIVRYEIAQIILSKYHTASMDKTIEAICVYESGMLDEFEANNIGKIKRAKKYKEYVDANGITAVIRHLNSHTEII